MNLEEAIYLVINEAEVSAIGETSDEHSEVLKAIEIVNSFYEQHGKHFSNFSKNEFNCNEHSHTDFCNDEEKMKDFNELSKEDFLSSYNYITEEEYNLTRMKQKNLT